MQPGSGHRAADVEDDGGRVLHARLLQHDPTAPADLADQYLGPLVSWAQRTLRSDDPALLETLAIDLILKVGQQPEQFNPDLASLTAYLHMALRGDLLNAQQREKRRADHLRVLDDVEHSPAARNTLRTNTMDPAELVLAALEPERIAIVRAEFREQDWEIVQMLGEGERRTSAFAQVLGLQGRPLEEQRREVKRAKDRIKNKLKRLWRRVSNDDGR